MTGTFCISLDFELMWGVKDSQSMQSYGANVLGVREALPQMLELFKRYDLCATWATVGFLFCRNKDELIAHRPSLLPEYANPSLSTYQYFDAIGTGEGDDPYHFAPSLMQRLCDAQEHGQEIASHSFSHFYCCEEGASLQSFEADIEASKAAVQTWGVELKSFVFARNQFALPHVALLAQHGITHVRSNEPHWAYDMASPSRNKLSRKLFRLADSYCSLSGAQTHMPERVGDSVHIPASRFLRPYNSKLRALDGLKLARIKQAMTHAAKHDRLFHLWWHPHNFGSHLPENMAMLRAIGEHFRSLQQSYGMQSKNMGMIDA